MRKKEVRWLSRNDLETTYKVWLRKPHKVLWHWRGKQICHIYDTQPYLAIKLKDGGLAKITIERQY